MCQYNPCLYVGPDNCEAYQAAFNKLSAQVASIEATAREKPHYHYYVKKINYKKTGKVGLILGKQFQFYS